MRNGSFRQNPALFILSLVFGLIGGLFFTGGLIGILVLTNSLTVTDPRLINPMLMLPAIFASMGALFLGVVVIIRIIAAKKRRKRQVLIANGRCVSAMVTDIVVDASVVVNGRPSRRVECCYTDAMTGKTYLYQSERLFSGVGTLRALMQADQTPFRAGTTVPVYIDRYDESRYYVDVESLMQNVVDYR